MDDLSRRGFLGWMLAAMVLKDLILPEPMVASNEAFTPEALADVYHTVPSGPVQVGLLSGEAPFAELKDVAFYPASEGRAVNAADVSWVSVQTGVITGVALYVGDELFFWAPLDSSKAVMAGDTFMFPKGSLAVTFD